MFLSDCVCQSQRQKSSPSQSCSASSLLSKRAFKIKSPYKNAHFDGMFKVWNTNDFVFSNTRSKFRQWCYMFLSACFCQSQPQKFEHEILCLASTLSSEYTTKIVTFLQNVLFKIIKVSNIAVIIFSNIFKSYRRKSMFWSARLCTSRAPKWE